MIVERSRPSRSCRRVSAASTGSAASACSARSGRRRDRSPRRRGDGARAPESRSSSRRACAAAAACGRSAPCRTRSDRSAFSRSTIRSIMRSSSATSTRPGDAAAISIWRWACWITLGLNILLDVALDVVDVARRLFLPVDFERRRARRPARAPCGRSAARRCPRSNAPDRSRPSSTRWPRRLAASANADEQVVLPTPPLPPKKTTWRSRRPFSSTAGCRSASARSPSGGATGETARGDRDRPRADRRRGIRQRGRFHEAEKQKEIVQLGGLLPEFVFVAAERNAVHELTQAAAKQSRVLRPNSQLDHISHRV